MEGCLLNADLTAGASLQDHASIGRAATLPINGATAVDAVRRRELADLKNNMGQTTILDGCAGGV